jgi:hypothetical protein
VGCVGSAAGGGLYRGATGAGAAGARVGIVFVASVPCLLGAVLSVLQSVVAVTTFGLMEGPQEKGLGTWKAGWMHLVAAPSLHEHYCINGHNPSTMLKTCNSANKIKTGLGE